MADIHHLFSVKASARAVFQAISTPEGLAAWWTKRSDQTLQPQAEFQLWFGPEYDWRGVVSRRRADREFELKMVRCDQDWLNTKVGFVLEPDQGLTRVRFHHLGWPRANDHYYGSCYCWAMYLRLLKRYAERGEVVPYEERLEA